MAVEIKQVLEREFDVILTSADIRSLTFAKIIEISESRATAGAVEDTKKTNSNKDPGFSLLFKDFEADEFDKNTLVNLSKGAGSTERAILIPGIEGTVLGALRDVGTRIKLESFALNYQNFGQLENITELASAVLKVSAEFFIDLLVTNGLHSRMSKPHSKERAHSP